MAMAWRMLRESVIWMRYQIADDGLTRYHTHDGSFRGSKGNTGKGWQHLGAVAVPATVRDETKPPVITGAERHWEDRLKSLTREPGDLPSTVQPISGGRSR